MRCLQRFASSRSPNASIYFQFCRTSTHNRHFLGLPALSTHTRAYYFAPYPRSDQYHSRMLASATLLHFDHRSQIIHSRVLSQPLSIKCCVHHSIIKQRHAIISRRYLNFLLDQELRAMSLRIETIAGLLRIVIRRLLSFIFTFDYEPLTIRRISLHSFTFPRTNDNFTNNSREKNIKFKF